MKTSALSRGWIILADSHVSTEIKLGMEPRLNVSHPTHTLAIIIYCLLINIYYLEI